jgi:hypothetical protein
MDQDNAAPEGVSRRSALKRGAIVGGALVWTTPVVQSLARPAFAQDAGSPLPGETSECRKFTGGGQVGTSPDRDVNYDLRLFCASSDATPLDGTLTINYVAAGMPVVFKLANYTSTCSGNGTRSPDADFNTITITGTGTVGRGGTRVAASIDATFVDNREGNKAASADRVAIKITTSVATPDLDLTVDLRAVSGGNLQAHKAKGNRNC